MEHHESFMSQEIHVQKGKPITLNLVSIKNGKGYKVHETFSKEGKSLKKRRKTLKAKEINHIMNRRFVPGLWDDCRVLQSRKKSKNNSRK